MPQRVFRLHALMAGHGDCIWLEYGSGGKLHRILIDGGTQGTYGRLKAALGQMPSEEPSHELLVVTHVDSDHIAGVLPLLDGEHAKQFKEVWFNGRKHLTPGSELEEFGAHQGEKLTFSIRKQGLQWNASTGGKQVALSDDGSPVTLPLPGSASVTILSPGWPQLEALLPVWDKEVKDAGLVPGIGETAPIDSPEGFEVLGAVDVDVLAGELFEEDAAKANGSSIALLIEYGGKRVLLGADAHPSVLVQAAKKLTGGAPLSVDVFKLPHHGSKNNVSEELLKMIPAKTYIFSSNGAYYGHPDMEAVARVVKYAPKGCELVFNCRTKFNDKWANAALQTKWGYTTEYGSSDAGVSVHMI